jgi:two-component system nitrogen regulation sensor histidine kinase NtrY
MTDTALASGSIPDAPPAQTPSSLLFSQRGRQALRAVGLIVVVLSVLVASGSFLIMTGATSIEPTPEVWTLIWVANGLLVLLVIALVVTEAMLLVQSRFLGQAGSGLQLRMVTMFALAAAVPAVIVAIVATISLNQGLDQWFSERTKTMVESSRQVARS